MAEEIKSSRQVFIGVAGILLLLIGSLAYAAWDSGSQYQPDRIKQFVDQQAAQELQ